MNKFNTEINIKKEKALNCIKGLNETNKSKNIKRYVNFVINVLKKRIY